MEYLNNLNLIDKPESLASSIVWKYSSRYYESEGPNAWNQGKIPFNITHHHLIVESYAKVIKTLIEENNDLQKPINILEIGGATGHFAWLLFNELERQLGRELTHLDVNYILSDIADTNLSFAVNHLQLKDYSEKGILHSIQFEISENNSFVGLHAESFVVIANYAFDSSPQDIFYIEYGEIKLLKPTIYEAIDSNEKNKNVNNIHISYEMIPITPNYYNEPEINAILADLTHKQGKGFLTFPINVLRFLNSIDSDKLILLISDLPRPTWNSQLTQELPRLNWQGGIWLPLDFEILNLWMSNKNGLMKISSSYDQHLTTAVCISSNMIDKLEKLFKEDFLMKSPDYWFSINNLILCQRDNLSIPEIMAWLNLCIKEPAFLKTGLEIIRSNIQIIGIDEFNELQKIARISQKYYFARPGCWDFFAGFAEIFFHLSQFELAKDYWHRSIYFSGENTENLFGLALTYAQLANYVQAEETVYRVLQIDSTNQPALELRDWIVENTETSNSKIN